MGTYTTIRLKNKSEKNIKAANKSLKKYGAEYETFNGIEYGYFITRERINEDCRFMNEDEEGKQQVTHFKRPITPDVLTGFFWNEVGSYCVKVSCLAKENEKQVAIMSKWLDNEGDNFVDRSKSENLDRLNILNTRI